MKVKVFEGAEQSLGLHGYRKIPHNTVFFFPNLQGQVVETENFSEPIKIYFLGANLEPVASSEAQGGRNWHPIGPYQINVNPDAFVPVPPGAAHLVETSFWMNLRPEFSFLREYL